MSTDNIPSNGNHDLASALATEQTMHAAWRKRAEEAEARAETFQKLLEKWLQTSERFSFLANDTRAALSGSSSHETPEQRAKLCHGKAHVPITTCATCGCFIGSVTDLPGGALRADVTRGPCAVCGTTTDRHGFLCPVGARAELKASEYRPLCAHGNFADECKHPHTDTL